MTEQLAKKIKLVADKFDTIVDFNKIASKIENKWIRFIVSAFEVTDKQVFKVILTEVIDLIPDKAHPVVEAWIDAFLAEDYLLLVDASGEFLAQLDLLKFLEYEKERQVYVGLLTFLVKLIPQKTLPIEE
jgi:hypothetical protein